jgi:hypothetical protein
MTGAAAAERQTEAASQKYGTVVFPSKERRLRQSGGTCRPIALKLEAQVSFERTSMDGPSRVEDLSSMEGPLRVSDSHMERTLFCAILRERPRYARLKQRKSGDSFDTIDSKICTIYSTVCFSCSFLWGKAGLLT